MLAKKTGKNTIDTQISADVERPRKKVFLGGTCNESTWQNEMIIYLRDEGLNYYNPVVEDWTPEHQLNEIRARIDCDFVVYTVTPKMLGCYSIAEVVEDSNKQHLKTVLVLLRKYDNRVFSREQWKSIQAVGRMVRGNGSKVFYDLKRAAQELGTYNENYL